MREKIPLEKQIEEIKMFLPFVGEFKTGRLRDGAQTLKDFTAQYIGISEPSCSQYGSYSLRIQNGIPLLCKCTYGSDEILKKFENIDQALIYIHKEMAFDY